MRAIRVIIVLNKCSTKNEIGSDIIENYYEILHIVNFAEIEIVKASYKAMTKLYHPDLNKNVDSSVMVKINLAYEVLGNQEKKDIYDKQLKEYLSYKKDSTNEKNINQKKDYSYDEKKAEEESLSNRFAKFIFDTASVVASAYKIQAEDIEQAIENTYYQGSSMSDEQLVRHFLKSRGVKRNGYERVLIERALLYKEGDKLVPSYTFKKITKNLR